MTSHATPILTLKNAKMFRTNVGISLPVLHTITGIPKDRLALLENRSRATACEPWLHEAIRLAYAFGCGGVRPLLGVADLSECNLGFDPRNDLDVWRTGVPLPLSTACRLAMRFGMSDPVELEVPLPVKQAWWIIASGERSDGTCPWCGATTGVSGAHLPTCWPHNLMGPRNAPASALGPPPKPRRPGVRHFASRPGAGLRRLREARGFTQAQMAVSVEIHPTHYGLLEACKRNLTGDLAEKIASLYKVDVPDLYLPDPQNSALPGLPEG